MRDGGKRITAETCVHFLHFARARLRAPGQPDQVQPGDQGSQRPRGADPRRRRRRHRRARHRPRAAHLDEKAAALRKGAVRPAAGAVRPGLRAAEGARRPLLAATPGAQDLPCAGAACSTSPIAASCARATSPTSCWSSPTPAPRSTRGRAVSRCGWSPFEGERFRSRKSRRPSSMASWPGTARSWSARRRAAPGVCAMRRLPRRGTGPGLRCLRNDDRPAPASAPRDTTRHPAREHRPGRAAVRPRAGGQPGGLRGQGLRVASDGRFVLGVAANKPAACHCAMTPPGSPVQALDVPIIDREFPLEQVNGVPAGHGESDARASPRASSASRPRSPPSRARDDDRSDYDTKFLWPVQGRISGVYGSQRVYNGTPKTPHSGTRRRRAQGHRDPGAGRRHRHLRQAGPVPDRRHGADRPRPWREFEFPAPEPHRREPSVIASSKARSSAWSAPPAAPPARTCTGA